MIRANNQAAVTALVQQLHPHLHKILTLQYTTLAIIVILVISDFVFGLPVPLGFYNILWISGDIVIGLVYRQMLNGFRVDNANEYLVEKGWLRQGKQKVVVYRYIKFLSLLFNILGLMQAKQFISLRSLTYFCLSLTHIPVTLVILLKTKDLQTLFEKINRVMNNFDIDFEQDKSEYLNELSIQQQKQVSK